MRIAEHIDLSEGGVEQEEGLRGWFLSSKQEVLDLLALEEARREEQRVASGPIPTSSSGLRRRRGAPATVQSKPESSNALQQARERGREVLDRQREKKSVFA